MVPNKLKIVLSILTISGRKYFEEELTGEGERKRKG